MFQSPRRKAVAIVTKNRVETNAVPYIHIPLTPHRFSLLSRPAMSYFHADPHQVIRVAGVTWMLIDILRQLRGRQPRL
jgi:hypothetical protein